jgi:chromate transporter
MAHRHWTEIASAFLKLGATAYGGPATMGIMQAEIQERRQWVARERFVEGLSLVNMLPGATAAQLAIFLGHTTGGWRGGVLAGLGFVLPGFCVMLALTIAYAHLGASPIIRGGLYGLGPVVLAIFAAAVYRLGRTAAATRLQLAIALGTAAAAALGVLGIASILFLAGGMGLLLFHSWRVGAGVLAALGAVLAVVHWLPPGFLTASRGIETATAPAGLVDVATFFFTVGALTFGGGLTMIAFIQEQVVNRFHWLTAREFIDGLALGQLTPGPVLVVTAHVGYKVAGLPGACAAAAASFLPSFILMLSILPMFERVRNLAWARAAMRGVGPAVIGALSVSLLRLAPHALPDPFAFVMFVGALIALFAWRVAPLKLVVAGGIVGAVRSRLPFLPGVRATW